MREFVASFWRAMGDRENSLAAVKKGALAVAVVYALLGVVAFSQAIGS